MAKVTVLQHAVRAFYFKKRLREIRAVATKRKLTTMPRMRDFGKF